VNYHRRVVRGLGIVIALLSSGCNALLGISEFADAGLALDAVADAANDAANPAADATPSLCSQPFTLPLVEIPVGPANPEGLPSYTTTAARDYAAFRGTDGVLGGGVDQLLSTLIIPDLGGTKYLAPVIAPENGQIFVQAESSMGTTKLAISGRDVLGTWTMPLDMIVRNENGATIGLNGIAPSTPTLDTPPARRRMIVATATQPVQLLELEELDPQQRTWQILRRPMPPGSIKHPQLSADGLRLVYVDGQRIRLAIRATRDAPFDTSVLLFESSQVAQVSSPFLADDCTYLYFHANAVYRIAR